MSHFTPWRRTLIKKTDTWMQLEVIILSEVGQRKTNARWTYLWSRNRLTDIENRLVVAKGEGRGGKDWEFGVSKCKLLNIGWIHKRSYCIAQGTIFNIPWSSIMEKKIKKNVELSHFAIRQRLAQHCQSTILQKKKRQTIAGVAEDMERLEPLPIDCRVENGVVALKNSLAVPRKVKQSYQGI